MMSDLTINGAGETGRGPNPYKGLAAFQEQDADIFWGREFYAEKLMNAVRNSALTAVIGPAGYGKSSLIFGGLIPRLRKEGEWEICPFCPGERPHQALTDAVFSLTRSGDGLIPGLDQWFETHPNASLLLTADQFEEIYTRCSIPEERESFIETFLCLSAENSRSWTGRLKCVFAMRASFLEEALCCASFSTALQQGDVKLGPLTPAEFKQIIEEPAAIRGVKFETDLVERILVDAGGDTRKLAFVEFALARLWEKQENRMLTHRAYEEIGGVDNALAVYADTLYETFSGAEKDAFRAVLIQLFESSGGPGVFQGRIRRKDMEKNAWVLIQRFMESGLMRITKDEWSGEKAEAVHESLVWGWPRLKKWMEKDNRWKLLYDESEKRRRIAFSRQLAAQASACRESEYDLSLLLSVLAGDTYNTVEARGSLLEGLLSNPRLACYLKGHQDGVCMVSFSPDGKLLASVSWDNTIILWDLARRQPIGPPLTGFSLAFSPDGKFLAYGTGDNTIILWDLAAGQPAQEPLSGHSDAVLCLAFSPDSTLLASGSGDNTIILWDVETGLPIGDPLTGHTDSILTVSFSPDGKMMASGGWDNIVMLWDMDRGNPKGYPLAGHHYFVFTTAFSPDGRLLASGSGDNTIILWNPYERQPLGAPLQAHKDPVLSLHFSPDGRFMASSGGDHTIVIWDAVNIHPVGDPIVGHRNSVLSVCFSPDSQMLASGSDDHDILLWNIQHPRSLSRSIPGSSVAFSPDGQLLASAGEENIINIWDTNQWVLKGNPLVGHEFFVFSIRFSPDGGMLASASGDNTIILWDLTERESIGNPLMGHRDSVYRVAFSPNGSILASASRDGTLMLWDIASRQAIGAPLTAHQDAVSNLCFTPDGNHLISAGWDKAIIIWDVNRKEPVMTPLIEHQDAIFSLTISPDGKTLASGGRDKTIILWDLSQTPPASRVIHAHKDSIHCMAFSPDGEILASGSADKTVILWDVNRLRPIGPALTGHIETVHSMAFSPDGRILASGGRDNQVMLWDINLQSWKRHACQIANRKLTPEEWKAYMGDDPYRC
jgi:WD40 repeat protein